MSRASFSIRKLINQRKTWPDSDSDNEEAFECSSAKTIRLQYELEQYQQQQLQKDVRHQHRSRSSWIGSNSSPKRKAHRIIPKPIVVVGHHSNDIVVHNGSAGKRISTPLPLSSRTGFVSPGTPHSQSSGSSLCSSCGGDGDCTQHHQRHGSISKDSTNVPSPHLDPRLSTPTMTAGWVSPDNSLCPATTTPTAATKKTSSRKSSLLQSAANMSLSPRSPRGNQGLASSQPTPTPTTTTNNIHTHHINTPTATTPAPSGIITPNSVSEAMHSRDPAAERVKIAEPYTLNQAVETGGITIGQAGGRDTPRAVQRPLVIPSSGDGAREGFVGEDEEDGEAVPDNVQKLIWRTDEAFRAVGTALAEARLASQSHPQSKELQDQVHELQRASHALQTQTQGLDTTLQILPASTYQSPVLRNRHNQGITSPISPTSGRGNISSSQRKNNNKSSPLSPSPDILRSPTRATSIKKAKRKSPSRPKTPRSATAGPPTPKTWLDLSSTTPKANTFSPSHTRNVSGGSSNGNSNSNGTGNSAHRSHHSYSRSLSKWNLKADNVTEKLFNGSRGRFGLHKIEADEVITPSQVQQYRQSRIAKAQAEAQAEALKSNSNESLRSTTGSIGGGNSDTNSANTPIEPFHLQDLPSRIGNSGVNLNVLSPVVEVPTPSSVKFEAEQDASQESTLWSEPSTPTMVSKQARQGQAQLATPPPTPPQPSPSASGSTAAPAAEEDTSVMARSHSFQNPVNKSPARPVHKRANSSSSRIPALPTIPEVRITAPQSHGHESPEPHGDHQADALQPSSEAVTTTSPFFEEDAEHMFLQSTPFTQTMPTFQHGRIRLAKADLVDNGMINSFESRLLSSPDEGLDWTAFQMAILGGAGDLLSDPSDFLSRDAHEDLVDDLCDWLGDFGLPMDALGTLVTEKEERRRAAASLAAITAAAIPSLAPLPAPSQMTAISPPGSAAGSFHDPSRNHSINHIVSGSMSSTSGGRSSGESARSSSEISDVQEMMQVQSLPIPVSSEHPSGFWNTRPSGATSRFFTGDGCGIKRWTLEGHPKRYQGPGIDVNKANSEQVVGARNSPGQNHRFQQHPRGVNEQDGPRGPLRESVDSLPQSPMLDLVMTTAVDGSKEFVPMGYNLGHDLGDFLKWESENVYATAFYGAD